MEIELGGRNSPYHALNSAYHYQEGIPQTIVVPSCYVLITLALTGFLSGANLALPHGILISKPRNTCSRDCAFQNDPPRRLRDVVIVHNVRGSPASHRWSQCTWPKGLSGCGRALRHFGDDKPLIPLHDLPISLRLSSKQHPCLFLIWIVPSDPHQGSVGKRASDIIVDALPSFPSNQCRSETWALV